MRCPTSEGHAVSAPKSLPRLVLQVRAHDVQTGACFCDSTNAESLSTSPRIEPARPRYFVSAMRRNSRTYRRRLGTEVHNHGRVYL
jgi:hypothetical protein